MPSCTVKMKYSSFYKCDLCQKKFDTGREVKCDVSLLNGTGSRVYADVCNPCLAKVADIIDDNFPRNEVLRRREELHVPVLV